MIRIGLKIGLLGAFLFLVVFCQGNNVRLNGTVKVSDVTSGVATLELDLTWENSWRDESNWDAVWVFLKYKAASGNWSHVMLEPGGHSATMGYEVMPGKSDGNVTGVFVYPGTEGVVRKASTKLTLKWSCGSGFSKSSFDNHDVFLLGQGIEMVYIPYGVSYAGDGFSENSLCDGNGLPLVIDSEDSRTFYQRSPDGSISVVTSGLSAVYPKGYQGYYVMKYELSQEQYVRFLNTLTQSEQEVLLGASFLSGLTPGRFLFGDTLLPSFRNGIVLRSKPSGGSYIFGHDLNRNGVYDENGDGQCIACNYLSLNDLFGYASWSGLRPMSELEYERACRSPFPQYPEKGEYVWNTSGHLSCVSSLLSSGKETEVASAFSNVNSNNSLGSFRGPVRCGAFAGELTTQTESGGTYWGVMEMGGNTGELVAGLTNTTFNKTVNGGGSFGLTVWSTAPSHYGVRGGSFAGSDSLLRTSDRREMSGNITSLTFRDSTLGFRLTRSLDAGLVTVDPGSISLTGPFCPGVESIIGETAAAGVSGISGNFPLSYIWSYSTDNGSSWTILPEEISDTLSFRDAETGKKYLFKRTAMCAVGAAFTQTPGMSSPIPNTSFGVFPAAVYLNSSNASGSLFSVRDVVQSGGTFSWLYNNSGIDDSANGNENFMTSNQVYRPSRDHFGDPTTVSGIKDVICRYTIGGCSTDSVVKVTVAPYNSNPCQGQTTVSDAEGNIYNIVKIGDQCWMQDNMNIGSFAGISSGNAWVYDEAGIQKWCNGGGTNPYTSNEANCDKYGGLYEWWEVVCAGHCTHITNPDVTINQGVYGSMEQAAKALEPDIVMSPDGRYIKGFCPDGWHLPTEEEWKQMEMHLGMSRAHAELYSPNGNADNGWGRQTGSPAQGTRMKSAIDNWNGTSVRSGSDDRDVFYGRPHGYRGDGARGLYALGAQGFWWSSSVGGTGAWFRSVYVSYTSVYQGVFARSYGFSVRCVRD